jgi:hypothetical protein
MLAKLKVTVDPSPANDEAARRVIVTNEPSIGGTGNTT